MTNANGEAGDAFLRLDAMLAGGQLAFQSSQDVAKARLLLRQVADQAFEAGRENKLTEEIAQEQEAVDAGEAA